MAFQKKTWKDRITEFPTRRTLTKSDGSSELVTVARAEGTVSKEGDSFSAENMNNLETRIGNEFGEINKSLSEIEIIPDYNNIIVNNVSVPVNTKHSVKTLLYTATEDCFIIFRHNNGENHASSDNISFSINNQTFNVFQIYGWMEYYVSAPYRLKPGDIVAFSNDLITIATYTVVGVR